MKTILRQSIVMLCTGGGLLLVQAANAQQADDDSPSVYRSVKNSGEEVPEWLRYDLFGRMDPADMSRSGGDDPWSAIEVPVLADTSRYEGNSNNSSGNYFSLGGCNCLPWAPNMLSASSLFPENGTQLSNQWFKRSEDWYTFTLDGPTTVWMSTCVQGGENHFDTAIAILDQQYTVVSMNDDWSECDTSEARGGAGRDGHDDDDDDDDDDNGCDDRFNSGLLVELPAGTYYAIVGGYQQERGEYDVEFSFRGTGSADAEDQPSTVSLQQNYPNPFNPSTEIQFSTEDTGFVELTVHNLVGETVGRLVNGMLTRGSHRVRFDSGALPSGVYIYLLRSGGTTQARKMVLTR
ncbi:MAG: T9SS type A sorting domain-containing protein [Calditrichaeota bacterium]|nr:T9SS type A sorting domain-containing protein [Candidatus Cloacimonadota bacterium]MCA9785005.1 T9SS type A sorting domain-containing protein [Candidatus Cloacimonadota bacterium]MCB1046227.1 T9SS type A sorting domain-containing protein [Calditrichota bacterium]MCB9474226.1 T9SS type A sorting domain-containing protein [Candidatus Delongbacteria bacterium]